MPNTYFQFKQFRIEQAHSGMKVTTDGCLFGAWVANWITQQKQEPIRILDIGTGTGLLSLMLAQVTASTRIHAIEINDLAYEEAKANFEKSPWSNRLTIEPTSLQQYQTDQRYDLIICNPPFFKDNLKGSRSSKNQAIHSDDLPMEELVLGIKRMLLPEGVAFVMYPEWEMEQFGQQMRAESFAVNEQVAVYDKKGDKQPIRLLTSFSQRPACEPPASIWIKGVNGEYTETFSKLLAAYYL